jgi:hypothetical protein
MNCKVDPKMCMIVALALITSSGRYAQADIIFGAPTNLGPAVNSAGIEAEPSISPDGLSLFFNGNRSGGAGGWDIWVCTRETTQDEWGTPVNLGSMINSPGNDYVASMTADGLTLCFCSSRSGGYGRSDIYMATRETSEDPWDAPTHLGPTINTSSGDFASISADGLTLYINSGRSGSFGGRDIWVSTRAMTDDSWSEPVHLGSPVNSAFGEEYPDISSDGLTLFFGSAAFASVRPGGYGGSDIWVTTRKTTDSDWGEPVNLGPIVNGPTDDRAPSISADGSTLYFASRYRSGGQGDMDLWQVSIEPVLDFSGDGVVSTKDLVQLIEHWGQEEPAFDIAPLPFGDGRVDAKDLEVLMSHWNQEVHDPTLLAHWTLDEPEGMLATDSVDDNNGLVFGNPVWQPDAGQVNGALEFDGIDDMVVLKPVLNPEDGPFSVCAWIKGGAPGQVILSQQTGVNWLLIDDDGTLMTDLASAGRSSSPLYSETVITDGNWHRVSFVWDGAQRSLYVDGAHIATDTQAGLAASTGGLAIGMGLGSQSGAFWSGTIDDVRIYDRVVAP